MLTSSGYGAISSIAPAKVYRKNTERETRAASASGHSNYDSVTLSSAPATKDSRFHRELVGRLSQEVRTANTTGDIQKLRQAVSSGSYSPDPSAIAARMLLLGEGN